MIKASSSLSSLLFSLTKTLLAETIFVKKQSPDKYTEKPEFTFLNLPKFVFASFYKYQRTTANLQSSYHSNDCHLHQKRTLDLIQLSVQTVNVRLLLH